MHNCAFLSHISSHSLAPVHPGSQVLVKAKAPFQRCGKMLKCFQHHPVLRSKPMGNKFACPAAGGPEGMSNRPESNTSPSVDPKLQSAKKMLRIPPSMIFNALAILSAALSALSLAVPEALLSAAFPPPAVGDPAWGALEVLYLRVAGATLVLSSAAELCLKDSAANGRLQSATYRRLMLGSILKALGYLAAFLSLPSLWSPLLLLLYLPACLLSLLVNSGTLWASGKNPQKPAASMALSPLPSSPIGWFYTILAAGFLAASLTCYLPEAAAAMSVTSLSKGPIMALLERTCAPGLLLASLACLNIRDAADRSRMGASTFKKLNLGLSGLAFASGFSLWASNLLISNSVLLAPAGVGLVCLLFSLSAQK